MIACYKIDDYFEFPLSTRNCITGVGVDADALPTFRVYEENNETAVATGNTAKRDDSNTTGCYIARAQCTAAAGFEVGKKYSVWASATVNAVSDTAPIGEFMIVPVNVWNSLFGGTDSLEVDATAISGDTTAADNAELMFDGTGYAGGTTKLQTAVTSIATDAITADALKTDAITEIVLGLLKYDFTGITGEAQRSLLNAARSLVNKIAMVDNTLTIYKEDDSTPAFTAAVTGDANVSPIVTIDPA